MDFSVFNKIFTVMYEPCAVLVFIWILFCFTVNIKNKFWWRMATALFLAGVLVRFFIQISSSRYALFLTIWGIIFCVKLIYSPEVTSFLYKMVQKYGYFHLKNRVTKTMIPFFLLTVLVLVCVLKNFIVYPHEKFLSKIANDLKNELKQTPQAFIIQFCGDSDRLEYYTQQKIFDAGYTGSQIISMTDLKNYIRNFQNQVDEFYLVFNTKHTQKISLPSEFNDVKFQMISSYYRTKNERRLINLAKVSFSRKRPKLQSKVLENPRMGSHVGIMNGNFEKENSSYALTLKKSYGSFINTKNKKFPDSFLLIDLGHSDFQYELAHIIPDFKKSLLLSGNGVTFRTQHEITIDPKRTISFFLKANRDSYFNVYFYFVAPRSKDGIKQKLYCGYASSKKMDFYKIELDEKQYAPNDRVYLVFELVSGSLLLDELTY